MDFVLRSNANSRVLMIIFGKVVTDESFLAGFAAVKDFVHRHGPHHGIADFSLVESFEMTNEMLGQLGSMAPAFPAAMRRIVVAPAPAAYVGARIVQVLRSATYAPIEITPTTDAAFAILGTSSAGFVEV